MTLPRLLSLISLLVLAACSSHKNGAQIPASTPSSGPRNITISWTANAETAVNSAGGGYKVYYSNTSGFIPPGSGTAINVPYVSGAAAPNSTSLTLAPGTYYVRVAAYSTLNTLSTASTQLSFTVP